VGKRNHRESFCLGILLLGLHEILANTVFTYVNEYKTIACSVCGRGVETKERGTLDYLQGGLQEKMLVCNSNKC
jgi:hypothetical protein